MAKFQDKYLLVKELGFGTFASTWLVQDRDNGTRYAAKILKTGQTLESSDEEKILELISSVKHENIVDYYGHGQFLMPDNTVHWVILLEYVAGLELFEYTTSPDMRGITLQNWIEIAESLFDGIAFLHENNVVHRDIKPENIIIREDSRSPVIVDFGTACSGKECLVGIARIGTASYASPELAQYYFGIKPANSLEFYKKADVWAAGLSMLDVVTRVAHPWTNFDGDPVAELREIASVNFFEEHLDPYIEIAESRNFLPLQYINLLRDHVLTNAEQRWSAQKILEKIKSLQ